MEHARPRVDPTLRLRPLSPLFLSLCVDCVSRCLSHGFLPSFSFFSSPLGLLSPLPMLTLEPFVLSVGRLEPPSTNPPDLLPPLPPPHTAVPGRTRRWSPCGSLVGPAVCCPAVGCIASTLHSRSLRRHCRAHSSLSRAGTKRQRQQHTVPSPKADQQFKKQIRFVQVNLARCEK